MASQGSQLKFDVQGQKLLMSSGIKDAEMKLRSELHALLS
jgi:hypothetical protein